MTETTLPGLAPRAEEHPAVASAEPAVHQWHLQTLQVINWGGFEGHHSIDFNADATLLTGASGTGKSTLMDANIALMMDSNIPFNGASNDNVVGRARTGEQRNPLSYVRGKINTSRDEDNRVHDETLRGQGHNTWSAVGATWVNTDGTQFTALRLYYAPATITANRDLKWHMATYPGAFNLADAEPFAQMNPPFHHARMSTRHPGLEFYVSYATFARELHKRLGIGRGGDGGSALRLLARIQAGRQVASVDGLFRDMVLEEPRTYEAATKAIEHFANLEAAHDTMRTAEEQVRVLERIPQAHTDLLRAEREVDLIDTFKVNGPLDAPSPWRLWMLRTKYRMLDAEVADVRRALTEATQTRDDQEALAARLGAEITENAKAQAENGGDTLDRIDADLVALRQAHHGTIAARASVQDRAARLAPDLSTATGFSAAQHNATTFLGAYDERRDALRQDSTTRMVAVQAAEKDVTDLKAEQAYLRGRDNLVPEPLDQARNLIADGVGLDPQDLPYVAELLDLHPDHEQWREAAELVLAGFARTILVDRTVARQFRDRLNRLRLGHRVNFHIADTGRQQVPNDPATLAGRLILKDSPFAGWLSSHLAERFDHECVQDPTGFRDDRRRRVTLTGQVQNGDRGAHGGHGTRRILGFSNAHRMAEVEQELIRAGQAVQQARAALDTAISAERDLDRDRDAHQAVLSVTWAQIDVDGAAAALAGKEEEKARLLASSDLLAELRATGEARGQRRDEAGGPYTKAKKAAETYHQQWEDYCAEQDRTADQIDELEQHYGVRLGEDHAARLDAEYEAADNTGGQYKFFAATIETVRDNLRSRAQRAAAEARAHREALTSAFEAFQQSWPRPNLGTGIESYPAYQAILDDLNEQGLAARRDKFTAKVIEWSGEDLLGLHQAYDDALDDIRQRLAPVNTVLAALPFGPNADRLRLTMEARNDETLKAFRKELRALASHVTLTTDRDEVETRFADLRRFMARIRVAQPGGTEKSQREHLLDVRRHVHIEAERVDTTTGARLGIYDTLGGKSGGETQELIAFIVGAALRYRLGDDTLPRPAYAPVFLDEGFVKSDSEFAGRAVDAWRGLGFQLIIGAPLDKVTAIEPYMDQIIQITKTPDGRAFPRKVGLRNRPRPVPTLS